MNKQQMLQLLKGDVTPALGCTEPACVALCAACAAKVLSGEIVTLDAQVSVGIYKNGMSAGIPHCSKVGLPYAAAIGACLQNPEKQLLVFDDLTDEVLQHADRLVERGAVGIRIAAPIDGLYVSCTARSAREEATCVIRGSHTNVVSVTKNGVVLYENQAAAGAHGLSDIPSDMSLAELRALVDTADETELQFLLDGVEMNETLASYSETESAGVGLAHSLRNPLADAVLGQNLLQQTLQKVVSAAESRLDGCPHPAMSSSGAGTKGLVVILPVAEAAAALHASSLQTLRALALAHLINRYINGRIGKLSSMCSCVMAASTAASAAITYLLGGTDEQISFAVRNMVGTVSGMVCDGGKVGCALKVATGTSAALLCALTAVQNAALRPGDGICAETAEDCIRNLARLGSEGMRHADHVIVQIMTEKHK